jgi:hypothetical protein
MGVPQLVITAIAIGGHGLGDGLDAKPARLPATPRCSRQGPLLQRELPAPRRDRGVRHRQAHGRELPGEDLHALGLQHTYLFDWTAPRPDEDPATIYLKAALANVPKYISSNVPDGGLVSSAPESVTFLRAFVEGRLFDEQLLERMMRWNSIFLSPPVRPRPEVLPAAAVLLAASAPRVHRPLRGHRIVRVHLSVALDLLAGAVDQVAPSRPFLLMITLARAAG